MLAQELHLEERVFTSQPPFQAFLEANFHDWPHQVQEALELIALHGIRDPFSHQPIPAEALELVGQNYRESLEHEGLLSRHRAVLLLLERFLADGTLPARNELRLYCTEAITPFAQRLQELFPQFLGSEFLPDPQHSLRGRVAHQDLCALTLPEASQDAVICNEVFEHLYNLPAALRQISRVLRPGGLLLTTFPFAYASDITLIRARHNTEGEPELIAPEERHGNPVDGAGSLVYQVPGWDILDQARDAGLVDPRIHWIASPSYGVIGTELPGIMVMLAQRPPETTC